MFIGHFALGFAASGAEPRLRLGSLLVASQLPDVIWPALVLAGVERVAIVPGDTAVTPLRFESYPISHGLVMVAVWGILLGGAHFVSQRRPRAALILALLAVSHWVLDFVTHRPDMPLLPGNSVRLGLGLWNSVAGTLVVEGAMFGCGVWLYATGPGTRAGTGRAALWVFAGVLGLIYVGNVFGPPPPSVNAVGISAILVAPIVWVWADWVDRRVRAGPAATA